MHVPTRIPYRYGFTQAELLAAVQVAEQIMEGPLETWKHLRASDIYEEKSNWGQQGAGIKPPGNKPLAKASAGKKAPGNKALAAQTAGNKALATQTAGNKASATSTAGNKASATQTVGKKHAVIPTAGNKAPGSKASDNKAAGAMRPTNKQRKGPRTAPSASSLVVRSSPRAGT